jgi:DNA-binding NarL/FixJ family response regulator
MPIRVVIADDQDLVRTGFGLILQAEADIEVAGEAENGAEAVAGARRLQPDVVVMDIRMPVMDGVEATRRIVRDAPKTRVLILTTFDADESVVEALRAGASGFLLKDAPRAQFVDAIRVVASGEALLAPSVTRILLDRFAWRFPAPEREVEGRLKELTERERETLTLIARGHSNHEIAMELGVAEPTVKSHISHLLMKLEARDRAQLVMLAYESGLVRPGALEPDA